MLQEILTVGFFTAFLSAAVRLAMPLMYGGLGEMIAERAGILNIGMEGVMLSGAFFSFAGAWYFHSIPVGLLCGMLGGMAVSLLHGLLTIRLAKDQSVSGLALNMLMLGVTSFLYKLVSSGQSYQQVETLPSLPIPGLSAIPVIGEAFFNRDILTYLLYVLIVVAFFFYRNTNWGLNFIAVGEHPRAAESAGIPVNRYRWIAMVLNGVLGGIGGAYLVLVQLGVFTENMLSGRGYIALATVILGRYTSFGVFGAALLFGAGQRPADSPADHRSGDLSLSAGHAALCDYLGGNAGRHRQEQSARGAEQALRQGHALIQRKSPHRMFCAGIFAFWGCPLRGRKKYVMMGHDRREQNESISHCGRDGPDVWPERADAALL